MPKTANPFGTPNINPSIAQDVPASFSTWGAVRAFKPKQSMRCAELALAAPQDLTVYLGPIYGDPTGVEYRVSAGVGGGYVDLYVGTIGPATHPVTITDVAEQPIIIPRVGCALHVAAQQASVDIQAGNAGGRYGAFCSLGRPSRSVVNRHVAMPAPAPDADYPLLRIPPFAVDFWCRFSSANDTAQITVYAYDGTPCSAALSAEECREPVPLSPYAYWLSVVSAAAEPAAIAFGVFS